MTVSTDFEDMLQMVSLATHVITDEANMVPTYMHARAMNCVFDFQSKNCYPRKCSNTFDDEQWDSNVYRILFLS